MILKEITMSHVWTTEITKKKEFWFVKKREKEKHFAKRAEVTNLKLQWLCTTNYKDVKKVFTNHMIANKRNNKNNKKIHSISFKWIELVKKTLTFRRRRKEKEKRRSKLLSAVVNVI